MKAVIFDCDGTLVDSEVISSEVLIEMLAEQGLFLTLDDPIASFRGRRMTECMASIEARLGHRLPDDFVPSLRTRMTETYHARLRPIDGAVELVRSLSMPGCVASSGPREKTELSLSLTGLLPFFGDRVFSSYDLGVWKPDPGLFLHAARTMGVAPSDCAVVEDSLPGIQAGVAAGMTVFAFQPDGVDSRIPAEVSIVSRLLELRDVFCVN